MSSYSVAVVFIELDNEVGVELDNEVVVLFIELDNEVVVLFIELDNEVGVLFVELDNEVEVLFTLKFSDSKFVSKFSKSLPPSPP